MRRSGQLLKERWGESVKAVIVPKYGMREQLADDAFIAWCQEHMAAYKVPRAVQLDNCRPGDVGVDLTGPGQHLVFRSHNHQHRPLCPRRLPRRRLTTKHAESKSRRRSAGS